MKKNKNGNMTLAEVLMEEKQKVTENNKKEAKGNKFSKLKENTKVKLSGFSEKLSKNKAKLYKSGGAAAGVVVLSTIIAISAASCNKQGSNNAVAETTTDAITTEKPNMLVQPVRPEVNPEIKPEVNPEISTPENDKLDLEQFATIKYLTKDELVTLFKNAEKEFEGTNVTIEELTAFVVEINKTIINSDLRQILMSSGVINENEEINRTNYLNTIDKIRNAMINAKTIIVDPELVGMKEYDELIQELRDNAVSIHISNLVSENSSEYEMYKLLDETYDKLGEVNNFTDAYIAYEPIREYVNSEDALNMPNNVEEEIFKDLYKDAYDEITAARIGILITEVDYYNDYSNEECQYKLTK